MKLSSLSKKIFLFFLSFLFCIDLFSEDSVDIWKKENLKKKESSKKIENISEQKIKTNININAQPPKEIEISQNNSNIVEKPIYGIFDPSEK